MQLFSKVKKYIFNPFLVIVKMGDLGLLKMLSDETYLKTIFWCIFHRKLNLSNPVTFNEKIQWLKINDRKKEYTRMVDKSEAKNYVASIIGAEHIVWNYGVWNHFDDIEFDCLPNQFVLKCTHDSGSVIIVKDKDKFNQSAAKHKIEKRLKKNFFFAGREWPYKYVTPRIIAEKMLSPSEDKQKDIACVEGITDYKFYCFNGEPQFLYVSRGMENHATARISFISLSWEKMPFYRKDYKELDELPPKPSCFNEMIIICRELAEGIPFLRVDLYEVDGKVFFSELTFYPCSGFMVFNDYKYDVEIGKMLVLSCDNT